MRHRNNGANVCVLVSALASSIFALYLAWKYPYGTNPDGHAYLDIADSWADGRIGDAINGYWSVLLPVLMAPLRFVGMGSTVTFAAVGAAAAFAVVLLTYLLGRELNIQRWVLVFFCTVVGVRAAIWAIEVWTPDLLFAAVGLMATLVGIRMGAHVPAQRWLLPGVALGVLFLTKPVGLLTGVAMGALMWLVWCGPAIRGNPRHALRSLAALVMGWAAIALSWIAVLSLKYGYLTAGSSSGYNLALTDWDGWGTPLAMGLYAPPFESAVVSWTDPTYMNIRLPYPIISLEGFRLIVSNIDRNSTSLWTYKDVWIWIFGLCVLGSLAVYVWQKQMPSKYIIVLGTALVQTIVYLPVLYQDRYLELSILLIALSSIGLMGEILKRHAATLPVMAAAVWVGLLLFPGAITNLSNGVNPGPPRLGEIQRRHQIGLATQASNAFFAPYVQECTRVVANTVENTSQLAVVQTMARSNGWYSSGNMQPDWSLAEAVTQLVEHQIDCVVVWSEGELPEGMDAYLTPLASTDDHMITLYRFDP